MLQAHLRLPFTFLRVKILGQAIMGILVGLNSFIVFGTSLFNDIFSSLTVELVEHEIQILIKVVYERRSRSKTLLL